MREIGKYRGQRKDNGEWVYGNYCNLAGLSYISEYPVGTGVLEQKKCIGGWVIVIPETVGESIRRKDKNGIMIYEGDKWRLSGKTFIVKYGESRPYESGDVIGNIHEEEPCQS